MKQKTVAVVTGASQGIGRATAMRLVSPEAKWMTGSSVRMDGVEVKGV